MIMIWIVIVFLVVAVLSLVITVLYDTANIMHYFSLGAIFSLSTMIDVAALDELLSPSITPMDVYKGKTTLEYKIVDGVKVDSTVIWKNKEG